MALYSNPILFKNNVQYQPAGLPRVATQPGLPHPEKVLDSPASFLLSLKVLEIC